MKRYIDRNHHSGTFKKPDSNRLNDPILIRLGYGQRYDPRWLIEDIDLGEISEEAERDLHNYYTVWYKRQFQFLSLRSPVQISLQVFCTLFLNLYKTYWSESRRMNN